MTFLHYSLVKDTGKTKVWSVDNINDGSHLGLIKWRGGWRKYVLEVVDPTVWSPDCLRSVADFIDARMEERRQARAALKRRLELCTNGPGCDGRSHSLTCNNAFYASA